MKKSQKRQTSLFLIELMIALLFFSFAAAISIRFFVGAHSLSETSSNLNSAILASTSYAEVFRHANGNHEVMFLPEGSYSVLETDGDTLFAVKIFYDTNWNYTSPDEYSYSLILSISSKDEYLRSAVINTFGLDEEKIYSLEVLVSL